MTAVLTAGSLRVRRPRPACAGRDAPAGAGGGHPGRHQAAPARPQLLIRR